MIISPAMNYEGARLEGMVSEEIREASERKAQEEMHLFGANDRPIGLVYGYLDNQGVWQLTTKDRPDAVEVWFG